ncbi:MAG: efflux RND transporter periplasmic adaptor subunit [Pirellulaceae bacterium]|nr:efflux RND transporter periplasmic adaptor subunit [Pirellulaceae bacterium]
MNAPRSGFSGWNSNFALALGLSGGLLVASAAWTHAADEAGLITVQVESIQPASAWETKATFSGIIKPKRKSELSFERSGRVDEILVEQGDRVTAGQTLARLNTEQLEAQLRKLEADQRAAEALLDELKAGPRVETIDAARANVREQEVQLELATSNLRRRQRLLQERLVAREEFDQAESAVERWEATRLMAQKQLEDLELGTRKEKLASQVAVIESLQAAIAAARVDLDHSVIKSPFDGSIIARDIDEGSVVGSGRSVLTISEDAVLQAHVGVPPAVAQSLVVGSIVRVVVRDQSLAARIKSVVAQVDEATRSQEVVATLALTPEDKVVPGDIARMEVARSLTVEGFWLDTAAVMQAQRGLWECYVIELDKSGDVGVAVRRSVEILQTEGNRVLVRGAIRTGDRVVVSAIHRLSAGQRVRPVVKPTAVKLEKAAP